MLAARYPRHVVDLLGAFQHRAARLPVARVVIELQLDCVEAAFFKAR
jgi:hypothetical protein